MAVKVKTIFSESLPDDTNITFEDAITTPGVYRDKDGDHLIVLDQEEQCSVGALSCGSVMRVDPEEDSYVWKKLTRLPIQSVTFTFEEE